MFPFFLEYIGDGAGEVLKWFGLKVIGIVVGIVLCSRTGVLMSLKHSTQSQEWLARQSNLYKELL